MTKSTTSSSGTGYGSRKSSADVTAPLLQQTCNEESRSSSTTVRGDTNEIVGPRHDEYDETKKGSVNFTLRYNFDKNALVVNIASATNLSPKKDNHHGGRRTSHDGNNPPSLLDPYIKLQLLPEKQHKVKTRVVRNTLNPIYDEEFTFYGLSYNQLQSTTLHFAVIAFDRYSRDEIIGEIICPLHTMDLSESDKQASVSMELMNRNSKVSWSDTMTGVF